MQVPAAVEPQRPGKIQELGLESTDGSGSGLEPWRGHAGDANAIAELREHHPESVDPSAAKLADAQFVLARTYGASSWTRLVQAVRLAEAIWRDDIEAVRELITQNKALIHAATRVR